LARKILLADDSVTAQNMGRKILADAGYDVITVNNGSAALKKIAELKPELIILDVYMPGYSGLEVCQRLKDSPETARVPVLLSVGKLEPFKPDEAKRVRAEGYIVKPFEASELLSALSKLEDRIVPKADAGKSGRSSRAVAITNESNRSGDEPEPEGSWKNRISFPSKKKDVVEESPDDAALYNAVNRDLKTVIQREEPKTQSAPAAVTQNLAAQRQDAAELEEKSEEKLVNLAALATPGLPKDVTTEEIAALAAAAAQVKGRKLEAESAAKTATEEIGPKEIAAKETTEIRAAEKSVTPEIAPAPIAPPAQEIVTTPIASAAVPKEDVPTDDEVSAALARLEQEQEHGAEQLWNVNAGSGAEGASAKHEDLPVTMAAPPIAESTHSVGPRWTAVPVALDPQEAALSLEREMSMAFRAFTSAAAAHAGPATMVDGPQSSAITATVPEAAAQLAPVDLPVVSAPVDSAMEAKIETEPAPVSIEVPAELARTEGNEFAVAPVQEIPDHSEPTAAQPDYPVAVLPQPVEAASENTAAENALAEPAIVQTAELTSVVATAGQEEIKQEEVKEQETPRAQFSAQLDQPGVAAASEITSKLVVGETTSAAPAIAETSSGEPSISQPAMDEAAQIQPEPVVMAEATASDIVEVAPTEIAADLPQNSSRAEAPQENESQAAAATAAAWASWRQIRDSIPEPKNQAVSEPAAEPASDSAPLMTANALAVAAGAESTPIEALAPGISAGMNSQTVASIVDSLLAELRPKIVEEISRKLAAEKK
jgi:CheY-like chemotaxis protein